MKVAIVFDTRTGVTAAVAERMAESIRAAGHECSVENVSRADPRAVARAGAVVLGCWTKGWFVIRQHPSDGVVAFIDKLSLGGRPVAVFATYKLAVGSTVTQMARAVEAAGGQVTGMYHVKGPRLPAGFEGWVDSLVPAT
jgi:flavodoxin I